LASLAQQIEELFDRPPAKYGEEHRQLFQSFKDLLNSGEARAAEPDAKSATGWRVNPWVKKGILLGFRLGTMVEMGPYPTRQPFLTSRVTPPKTMTKESGVRIVPGGSSIRDGSYVARGVVCMPPMFINVGAHVDEGTMWIRTHLSGVALRSGKTAIFRRPRKLGGDRTGRSDASDC